MTLLKDKSKRKARNDKKNSGSPVFEPETTEIVTPVALLDTLSYRELQVAVKDRGLKASGSRAKLIERLASA